MAIIISLAPAVGGSRLTLEWYLAGLDQDSHVVTVESDVDRPRTPTNRRIPELDGVRGIAVILVTLAHANVVVIRLGGIVGVTLFFVLSGYLITGLLVREQSSFGRVSLGAFYVRRALRLLPALVVAVAGGSALWLLTDGSAGTVGTAALATLFYVANLAPIWSWNLGPFSHLWSLAMEEQFYGLWPLCFVLIGHRWPRILLGAAVVGSIASLIFRFSYDLDTPAGYLRSYNLPHTNVFAVLFGSALALALARSVNGLRRPPTWVWPMSWVTLLATASLLGMRDGLREIPSYGTAIARLSAGPIAAVCAVGILWYLATRPEGVRWLCHPVLLFFGKISYGLYLWHTPLDRTIGQWTGTTGPGGLVAGLTSAVLAVGVAVLSFRYVEMPFLRRKGRFERHADGSAPQAAPLS